MKDKLYKNDSLINKVIVFYVSLLLAAVVVLLYFLDDSLRWSAYKIGSCIIISIWLFFMTPSIRSFYLINKNKTTEEWVKIGYRFGISGIFLPVLLAPFYGAKYYFC